MFPVSSKRFDSKKVQLVSYHSDSGVLLILGSLCFEIATKKRFLCICLVRLRAQKAQMMRSMGGVELVELIACHFAKSRMRVKRAR